MFKKILAWSPVWLSTLLLEIWALWFVATTDATKPESILEAFIIIAACFILAFSAVVLFIAVALILVGLAEYLSERCDE